MPELPEVETIRISLMPLVTGKQIDSVQVLHEGVLLSGPDHLTGLVVTGLERRGKYLQLTLSDGGQLLVHLRMTGRLVYAESCPNPEKHTHLLIQLSPSGCLAFTDPRRFGRLLQVGPGASLEGTAFAGLAKLGPEPLGDELTVDYLAAVCRRHARAPIKSLLLNQQAIAGLGNIYADEVLFLSRINPRTPAGKLPGVSLVRLQAAIRTVISKAIDGRGTTLRDYVDGNRVPGNFQYELQVYGRKGQPCNQCGRLIESCSLAGRTTCYCPACQQAVIPGKARNQSAANRRDPGKKE